MMRRRGVDVADVERVAGGKTFFWRGEYGWDLNSRETLDTQLGVFEGFQPKLSERSRASDVLFLANIQPDLQREVRAQLPDARFVALDSMNLWIDIARDSLVQAIESVDCVILNDAELRQLTGKPNLVVGRARDPLLDAARRAPAARAERDRRQAGRVRRRARHARELLRAAGLPAGDGDRPDRRRRHVRGRASSATSPPTPTRTLSDELLRRAMAHGTVLASFNVEEFGTERIERLDGRGDRRARRASCTRSRSSAARRSSCAADRASSHEPRGLGSRGVVPMPRRVYDRHEWTPGPSSG